MRLPLLLALLPGVLAAQEFDGTYRQAANADCALVGVDGGAVEIREGLFHGVGSECRMTKPVDVVGMDAQLFTMICSGKDHHWTERAMLMHSAEADGIIMLWNGYAFSYERCPSPSAEDSAQ